MKLSLFVFASFVFASVVVGCSSGDGEIAIDAATTRLTAEANDQLFIVRLLEARDDGYALDGLVVKALPDGKEALVLTCTPTDTNGNKKLDKGESLSCAEGPTNQLGTDVGGTELEVEVYATIDAAETKVGSATWTVAK
jgi:hypothetical protein